MSELSIILLASVSVVAIIVVAKAIERRRRDAIRQVAAHMGMAYQREADPAIFSAYTGLPLFQKGHGAKVRNVVTGEGVTIFDYRYTTGSGKHRSTHRQTVAAFAGIGRHLPSFRVAPANLLDKIRARLGGQGIDFPEDAAFSSAYRLRGTNQDAVRTLFGPGVRLHLLRRKVAVEGVGDHFVVYRAGRHVSREDYSAFVMDARVLSQFFGA